jgi:hypothetical protein
MLKHMERPMRRIGVAGGAIVAAVLAAAVLPRAGSMASQPEAGDSKDAKLIADLEANAALQEQGFDRMQVLYRTGRLSLNSLNLARIAPIEAKVMVLRIRGDRAGMIDQLRELVKLREGLLEWCKGQVEEPPETCAELSQELAEARVRLWEAEGAAR